MVQLKGAERPRGSKRRTKPNLQWLDEYTAAYYQHLVQDQTYDFIIGHAPYLANGCFNFKTICRKRKKSSKIILMFHQLPKDENGDIDDETLIDWLNEVDVVFSLGRMVENEMLPYIAALDPEKRPIHKMYFPFYPLELFSLKQESVQAQARGTQNVSMMNGEIKDLEVNGLDFPLAVAATAQASKHIRDFNEVRINLSLLVPEEEEKREWKETFGRVLERRNLKDTGLSFQPDAQLTVDKMKIHMRKSNLLLLPLKQDSPLFGTEALAAIAAGVPVLVSKDSGLASLLSTIMADEPVVYKKEFEASTETWKDRIIQKLRNPEEAQLGANRLQKQLLLDTSIAQTHLDFINTVAGTFRSTYFLQIRR